MIDTIGLAIPLFVVLLLGFVAGKAAGYGRRFPLWLDRLVFWFALPALVFQSVAGSSAGQVFALDFVIGTTLATYITFMLMFIVAVTVGQVRTGVAALQASSASRANIGYLGVPVAVILFGAEGGLAAALVLLFDSILHAVLVPLIDGGRRPRRAGRAALEPLRQLFADPPVVAVMLAALAAAAGLDLPRPVESTIGILADAAVPAAMFAVGVSVACLRLGHVTWEVPVVAIFKLVLHPALTLAILLLLGGIDPLWVSTAVVVAALPTAASVPAVARRFDSYANGASNGHLITTLVSVATVAAVVVVIAEGRLPTTSAQLFP